MNLDLAAAIDIGSNTLRLLIARPDGGGRLEQILLDRQVTRLSQNLKPGGRLFPEAKARTLAVLDRFAGETAGHDVSRVFGGATAAVRLAVDGEDFLAEVKARTGLTIRKLAGEEEARLTAVGLLSGLADQDGRFLAVDPGGQSTEFIPLMDGQIGPGLSLDLGVVGLTEEFLRNDPPTPAEMAGLTEAVTARLARVLAFRPPRAGLRLLGTAGTVTTIAAMLLELTEYRPERVTGFNIGLAAVDDLLTRLLRLRAAQRRDLPGLEPGREDVIIPGLVLVKRLIEVYGLKEMTTVDAGLLEGLIIDGLNTQPQLP